jgi:hypothetical protein
MGLSATTLPTLGDLFVARIEATTPRITYKGAEGWKHYKRPAESPTRTRRFRLLWDPGGFRTGGTFTNARVQLEVGLRVVTDYAGVYEQIAHIVQDDWQQLRDRMQALASDDSNGLLWVRAEQPPVIPPEADVVQVELTYRVSYAQSRP